MIDTGLFARRHFYAARDPRMAIHIATNIRVSSVSCRDVFVIGLCFRDV
jgi:hypothetical protein